MVLNDKVYDVLKYIGRIVLPCLATLIVTIFKIWRPELELGDMIGATIMAVDVFLNGLLEISSANYKVNNSETEV